MTRFRPIIFCILLLAMTAMLSIPAQKASAHGGFVIESGEIDNYEWSVSIFPYPVMTSATVLSILLYDKVNNLPAMDLTGEVYLAEPGDTRPCCEPGVHRGPFLLTSDHDLYPGDYTTFIPIDAAGRWQVLFVMKSPSGDYGIVTGFDAIPYGDGSQPIDKPAIATQVSIAFAAAVAASEQRTAAQGADATPQAVSPLAQPDSPLANAIESPLSDPTLTTANIVSDNSANNQSANSPPASADSPVSNRMLMIVGGLALVVIVGVIVTMTMGGRKGEGAQKE